MYKCIKPRLVLPFNPDICKIALSLKVNIIRQLRGTLDLAQLQEFKNLTCKLGKKVLAEVIVQQLRPMVKRIGHLSNHSTWFLESGSINTPEEGLQSGTNYILGIQIISKGGPDGSYLLQV